MVRGYLVEIWENRENSRKFWKICEEFKKYLRGIWIKSLKNFLKKLKVNLWKFEKKIFRKIIEILWKFWKSLDIWEIWNNLRRI